MQEIKFRQEEKRKSIEAEESGSFNTANFTQSEGASGSAN